MYKRQDDVLRDLFKRGKYPDVILPMCVIRRMDAVLELSLIHIYVNACYDEGRAALSSRFNYRPINASPPSKVAVRLPRSQSHHHHGFAPHLCYC